MGAQAWGQNELHLTAAGYDNRLCWTVVCTLHVHLLHLAHNVHAIDNSPENHVLAVEVGGLSQCYEELATIRIRPTVRHGEKPWTGMQEVKVLIRKGCAVNGLAAAAVALLEVATLADEAFRHTVKYRAPVVEGQLCEWARAPLTGAEAAEVVRGPRRHIIEKLEDDATSWQRPNADVHKHTRPWRIAPPLGPSIVLEGVELVGGPRSELRRHARYAARGDGFNALDLRTVTGVPGPHLSPQVATTQPSEAVHMSRGGRVSGMVRRRRAVKTAELASIEDCDLHPEVSSPGFKVLRIPVLNSFWDLFAGTPRTPEQVKEVLNIVAVVASLLLAAVMAIPTAFDHDELVASALRLGPKGQYGFESTEGDLNWEPFYMLWQNTTAAIASLMGSLMITLVTYIQVAQTSMRGPDGKPSQEMLAAFWQWTRFTLPFAIALLIFGIFTSFQSIWAVLLIKVPIPPCFEGTGESFMACVQGGGKFTSPTGSPHAWFAATTGFCVFCSSVFGLVLPSLGIARKARTFAALNASMEEEHAKTTAAEENAISTLSRSLTNAGCKDPDDLATSIVRSGLDRFMLSSCEDVQLLNDILKDAGVAQPGDRLKILSHRGALGK